MNVHAVDLPCGHMEDGDEELTDPNESCDITCRTCLQILFASLPPAPPAPIKEST